MSNRRLWSRGSAALAFGAATAALLMPGPALAQRPDTKRVLIFTGTTGYRHGGSGTIGTGTQAIHPTVLSSIQAKLAEAGIASDVEDCNGYAIPPADPAVGQCNHADKTPRIFSPENLTRYDAIFLMNASSRWGGGNASQRAGVLFGPAERQAIIAFVNRGGGICCQPQRPRHGCRRDDLAVVGRPERVQRGRQRDAGPRGHEFHIEPRAVHPRG
jgi:hypothetical protein